MLPLVIYTDDPESPDGERQYVFIHSPVRIGRSPMNDLVLGQGFVSQFHGQVRFDAASTVFVDLGATNRTNIDGEPIAANVPVPVDEHTQVSIGPIRLHFLREDVAPPVDRARVTQFHQVASLTAEDDEEGPAQGSGPGLIGKVPDTFLNAPSAPKAPAGPAGSAPQLSSAIEDVSAAETSSKTMITSVTEISEALPEASARSGKPPVPGTFPELDPISQELPRAHPRSGKTPLANAPPEIGPISREIPSAPANTPPELGSLS
ncbi:MAG TPA: FHA domain-containing protein, partial [Myxococcaceae bacterium]|nr:FHA domain-containing protein [Myxococcaceae bacterium]